MNGPNIFVDQGQFIDSDFISDTHQKENVQFANVIINSLTSGRPTKPYSWGRMDLLLRRILVLVDSWMVQQPKLMLAISNSMSDVVTTACTVNGTGCVCKTKQIYGRKIKIYFNNPVKPVLRGHLWEKEKVAS